MLKRPLVLLACLTLLLTPVIIAQQSAQGKRAGSKPKPTSHTINKVPTDLMLRILKLEDERNLNGEELTGLLFQSAPAVRSRAALAIGRIGDKRATKALLTLLEKEEFAEVQMMAAFALGEMEDSAAAPALLSILDRPLDRPLDRQDESLTVRARVVEALGKIASVPVNIEALGKATIENINAAIIRQFSDSKPDSKNDPKATMPADQKLMTSLAITALMRLRVPASVEPLAAQLKSFDADIRAEAGNALFRLRAPIEAAIPALLEAAADKDRNVRANAARALGLSKSKDASIVRKLYSLINDPDDQVRTNAARGLSALAASDHQLATEMLIIWCGAQLKILNPPHAPTAPGKTHKPTRAPDTTRIPTSLELEMAAVVGTLKDKRALPFLTRLRATSSHQRYPEIETSMARLDEAAFLQGFPKDKLLASDQWRQAAAMAQGLGEVKSEQSGEMLLGLLKQAGENKLDARAVPDILRALAKHKPASLQTILRDQLKAKDVGIRAAAAGLLDSSDENLEALINAFAQAGADTDNDAKLALLTALSKYKNEKARTAIISALDNEDHLIRRAAMALLKPMSSPDDLVTLESKIGIVKTNHDEAFYQRALRRMTTRPVAVIHTKRGLIRLELFADDAPLTVDNFITLARRGYFNGIVFHRVVPNFVIQGGDPRGDGSGGPGYAIRCEINLKPYKRGTLGMALSGKDTGGSQFFITHSPQPHLDGGYTVFGQVLSGMDVVDQIRRGDVIESIEIIK